MLLLDLSNTATRCIGAVTFYSVLHYLVADERLMRGTVGYCRLSCRLWTSYMKSFDCTTYRDTALSVFTSQRSTTGKVATLPRFTAQTKSTALLVLQVLRKIETRMGIVLRVMRKAETRMGLSCILCKCYQVACSACACAETRQRTAGRKTHWVYTQPKAVVVCSV